MKENVFVVSGKDEFLKNLFVKKEIEKSSSVVMLDAQEIEYRDLLGLISARKLYSNDRNEVIVIKHAEKLSLKLGDIAVLMKHIPPYLSIYFVFDDNKSKTYGYLRRNAVELVFDPPYGYKLKQWVKDLLRESGFSTSSEVVDLLSSLGDTSLIYNKISQMKLLFHEKKSISKKDLFPLFREDVFVSNFAALDGILRKDRSLLLSAVYSSRTKEDVYKVFYSVLKYIHAIFVVKALFSSGIKPAEIKKLVSSKLGLHPFVTSRLIEAADLYSLSFLKDKIPYLLCSEARLRASHYDVKDIVASAFFYLFSESKI